jgi:hypothetical protein
MPKFKTSEIPIEWDLKAGWRYKRQNMEKAMKGKIERGLVELITNSDDSYRTLEEEERRTSGKIRIEIERRRKGPFSVVVVRDRAVGMSREEIYQKLGTLGERTSGFEKGKARRGLHGRGARDVAAFGTVVFESIKDEEYNCLEIPASLKCRFTESHSIKATPEIREKLGIPKGSNGTIVTIKVHSRFKIPQHEKLKDDFPRYYSLRDIFSDPKRKVTIVDRNRELEDPLVYVYPAGEVVYNDDFPISGYDGAMVHLFIRRHETPFEQAVLPYREGILIKSSAAIHDCTYFTLESEPFCWRFTGELRCDYIDKLIREYDDREEANPDDPGHPIDNPYRLLDPFRDGLILDHPFTQQLYKKCKEILESCIKELKAAEEPPKQDVTDENLDKKLTSLSKEISKVFEKKLNELEEEIPEVNIDDPKIRKLGLGLHIIPPDEQPIIVNTPKTFSIIVKHYEPLDESLPVNVLSSDPDIVKLRVPQVFFKKILEEGKVGRTTFTVESSELGAEACIEVRYDGYDNLVLVKVVEPPSRPPLPDGLTFERLQYRLQINKEKNLVLRLKTSDTNSSIAEIVSSNPEIVIKGGGRCKLRETELPGVLFGGCKIVGRQLKARGVITALVEGFEPAKAHVVVEEHEPVSEVDFKFDPIEDDFGAVRYKWDDKNPYRLLIGAKHPSIRRYLGELTDQGYPGKTSQLYHTVLAEVIAEALAFRILERKFYREGQDGMLDYTSTDTYYHKELSEFLSIAHRHLSKES